jgi:arabinofuranosyltransferase
MSTPPAGWAGKKGTVAATLGASLALLAHMAPTWASTVDDAWISARYAANLAHSGTPTFSIGQPAVEGFTNAAWTGLLAAGIGLGTDPQAMMVGMGALFGVLTLWCAAGLTATLSGGRHTPAVWLAPWLIALDPHMAVSSTNGLETTMHLAALLGASWAGLASVGRRDRALAGALAGAAMVVRPEGALVGIAFATAMALRRDKLLRSYLGGLAAVAVPLVVWRVWVFNSLLPNTFHAKAAVKPAALLEAHLTYLSPALGYWLAAAAALAVATVLQRRDRGVLPLAAIALGSGLSALQVVNWMPGGRLWLPCTALGAVLVAHAIARRPSGAALLALVGMAAVAAGPIGTHARDYDRRHSVLPDNDASLAARHMAQHAPEGAWMLIRDAGVFAYHMGTGVAVGELHPRALTRPHPGQRPVTVEGLVVNPAFLVLTQARVDTTGVRYKNDREAMKRLTVPYDYLGRVHQHHHRYYDVWTRGDLAIPALPEELVCSWDGAAAREAQSER